MTRRNVKFAIQGYTGKRRSASRSASRSKARRSVSRNRVSKRSKTPKSTVSRRKPTQKPQRANANIVSQRKSVRVSHQETIQNVHIQSEFKQQLDPTTNWINPGNAALFPWLSGVAEKFEEYTIHSLTFSYTNYVSSMVSGGIVMAYDPDRQDADPTDIASMAIFDGARKGNISRNLSMVLHHGMLHKAMGTRFVRSGTPLGVNDLKTYDSGRFFLATMGEFGADNQGTRPTGTLSVKYDITFYAPTIHEANHLASVSGQIREWPQVPDTNILSGVHTAIAGGIPIKVSPSQIEFIDAWQGLLDVACNFTSVADINTFSILNTGSTVTARLFDEGNNMQGVNPIRGAANGQHAFRQSFSVFARPGEVLRLIPSSTASLLRTKTSISLSEHKFPFFMAGIPGSRTNIQTIHNFDGSIAGRVQTLQPPLKALVEEEDPAPAADKRTKKSNSIWPKIVKDPSTGLYTPAQLIGMTEQEIKANQRILPRVQTKQMKAQHINSASRKKEPEIDISEIHHQSGNSDDDEQ